MEVGKQRERKENRKNRNSLSGEIFCKRHFLSKAARVKERRKINQGEEGRGGVNLSLVVAPRVVLADGRSAFPFAATAAVLVVRDRRRGVAAVASPAAAAPVLIVSFEPRPAVVVFFWGGGGEGRERKERNGMLEKERKKQVQEGKKTQNKNSPEELEVGGRGPVDTPLAVVDADPLEVFVRVCGVGGAVDVFGGGGREEKRREKREESS